MLGSETSFTEAVFYPILGVIGVPVNLLTIAILARRKCSLSESVTRYLIAMAAADLMVIIFNVILYRMAALFWLYSFLQYTAMCKFVLYLSPTSIDCSVWLMVAFTFDRFVAICCQKLQTKYCTGKTAAVVIITVNVLFGLENIPWPFAYRSYYKIDLVPSGCLISSYFYAATEWKAFSSLEQVFTPLLPFLLILLFNALTVRHILLASLSRKRLWVHSNNEKNKDPEMLNRRKSIVLLFALSSSFILLWVTTVIYFIFYRFSRAFKRKSVHNAFAAFQEAGIMLQLLSSCTNTVIYTATQRKFREELYNVLKYPFTVISKCVKLKKQENGY